MDDSETPLTVRRSLSPSRAGDFQNCPLLYRFRTIDRLPEPADPIMVRGTLVHAVLEDLFGEAAPGRTLDRAVELLPGAWDKLRAEEPRLAELFTAEQVKCHGADAHTEVACHGDVGELVDQHREVEREHEGHGEDVRVGVGPIIEPLSEQVDESGSHDQE